MIAIENVQIVAHCQRLLNHKILIKNQEIEAILPREMPIDTASVQKIDGKNLIATAGFIDIHLHSDADFLSPDKCFDLIKTMQNYQARQGVTGLFPSLVPIARLDFENLRIVSAAFDDYDYDTGAKLLGIHLEGPFLNPQMCGGFPRACILEPSLKQLEYWQQLASQRIRRITISPEIIDNLEIVDYAHSENMVVALGHTAATDQILQKYFQKGVRLITHFLNAMQPFHHRQPGPVGAILAEPAYILEIIADGFHLDPITVKFCMNLPHTKILITDSTYVLYLPEGHYSYLGQDVIWNGKEQKKADGTLVGSALTLNRAVINTHKFTGRPLAEIIPMANQIPATVMGLTSKGVLEPGYDADLILMDEKGNVYLTMIEGKIVHNALSSYCE